LKSWIFDRPLDDDFARLWRVLKQNPEAVVLGLGVFLRVIVYLDGRSFWMDESSLWGNLAGKRVFDFSEPLTGDQLAPFGFLIAQRTLMAILGTSKYASRLIPLASGLVAFWLFARLVRRLLSSRPALIALALFAFSDDLIYYSSELKPYSTDLAIGLAISLAALDAAGKPASGRRLIVMAVLALAAPWCSFASTFVVAGCGATLILTSLRSGRWRDSMLWIAIGIGWVASLFVSYRASAAMLSPYTTMYVFWDFAFLPVWPLPVGRDRLAAAAGILLEVFVTPLNLVAPVCPWVGVLLPISLLALGATALARRSWSAWSVLVLPIAMAMVASMLKRYPFHGRLILELVPAFLILIAEGSETVRSWDRGPKKLGYSIVLILLFTYPCLEALRNSVSVPVRDFNSHGDLRKNLFMTRIVPQQASRRHGSVPLIGPKLGV
jgi:hypothetical protein